MLTMGTDKKWWYLSAGLALSGEMLEVQGVLIYIFFLNKIFIKMGLLLLFDGFFFFASLTI